MTRPGRFEDFRYLGDKRTQRVYDLDLDAGEATAAAIDELVASRQYLAFSPDTLAEARNRGYRPDRSIRVAAAADDA
jgi:hypothetical protein